MSEMERRLAALEQENNELRRTLSAIRALSGAVLTEPAAPRRLPAAPSATSE